MTLASASPAEEAALVADSAAWLAALEVVSAAALSALEAASAVDDVGRVGSASVLGDDMVCRPRKSEYGEEETLRSLLSLSSNTFSYLHLLGTAAFSQKNRTTRERRLDRNADDVIRGTVPARVVCALSDPAPSAQILVAEEVISMVVYNINLD